MEKYNLSMRILHWVVALMIFALLYVGITMTDMPEGPERIKIYNMHKSFGLSLLILAIIRLINRLYSKIPQYPVELNNRDVKLSKATVHILYLLIIIMPISGYFMSSFGGYAVIFFGYTLPQILPVMPDVASFFRSAHYLIGMTLIAVIALHLLGSIKHYFVEKVNLLKRIW